MAPLTSSKWRTALIAIQIVLLVVAVGCGIGLGVGIQVLDVFRNVDTRTRFLRLLHLPAEIVLRLINLFYIPLSFVCVVSGFGFFTWKNCGRSFLWCLLFTFALNVLAIGEGLAVFYGWQALALANVSVWPITGDQHPPPIDMRQLETYIYDIVRTTLPDSVLEVHMTLKPDTDDFTTNGVANITIPSNVRNRAIALTYLPYQPLPVNFVGLIVFSVLVGIALASLQARGKLLFAVSDGIFDVFNTLFKVLIWFYPIAVIFIVSHNVVVSEDPIGQLKILWIFWLCVGGMIIFHVAVVLPVLFVAIIRANPYKYFLGCFHAMFTAFVFNDRKAAVPVSIGCLRHMGLERHVARLVVVIATVLNHDVILIVTVPTFLVISSSGLQFLGASQTILVILAALAFSLTMTTGHTQTIGHVLPLTQLPSLPSSLSSVAWLRPILPFDWLLYRLGRAGCAWSDCVISALVEKLTVTDGRPFASGSDGFEATEGSLNNDKEEDGMPVLTQYDSRWQKDWTLKLINETGDKLVISKV